MKLWQLRVNMINVKVIMIERKKSIDANFGCNMSLGDADLFCVTKSNTF